MPLLRRQGTQKRIRRTDRRGMSPVTYGAIAAVVLLIVVFFGFTKHVPFTHGFRVNAVFENANAISKNAQVRIAGVNVGKVVKVTRYENSNAALVQMEINDKGLPIHKDATAKIRPRIFLEGNFFVDLKPGSPSAPRLEDDDAPLGMAQTAAPVQFGDVLTALQADPRLDLQTLLINLGKALNGKPTAADDAQGDPDVRGETAAVSLRGSAAYSAPALRNASIINSAILGEDPDDLGRLIKGLARVSGALDRNEGALQGLVVNFNRTNAIFADEQANLRATIRELPPTLVQLNGALDALNAAFPPTRAFATTVLPGVKETGPTIDASFPFVRQLRALVSEPELRGLVNILRPTTADLSSLVDATIKLLPEVDAVNKCVIGNISPVLHATLQDGDLSSNEPVYKELAYGLIGAAGESQNFDPNGQYVRFQPGGGANTVATGPSTFGGPRQFANVMMNPTATRPARPAEEPPYRPDVACATQDVPNLIARTGGAETQVGTDNQGVTARSAGSGTATSGIGERLAGALTPEPPGTKTTTTGNGGAGK
jgi:virulence factor Mce-like protein